LAGVKAGASDVVARLTSQDTACPKQLYALVGYSQGAGAMNSAAKNIPAEIASAKIKALVMFGDPSQKSAQKFTPTLMAKLFENCEACDMVTKYQLLKY
jgi:hypothetical protein